MSRAHLIALDWGTTNVRAALLDGDANVLEERRGISGVGELSAPGFGERFDELIEGWPALPAIAAGMVGSRQGWKEAGYLPCPADLAALAGGLTQIQHGERTIHVVPGLKVQSGERFDVIRGEETQIAGLLADQPSFSGTVVLPGTHSKWVRVNEGLIEQFSTYMTGELFDLLSKQSILRHAVLPLDGEEKTASEQSFSSAVRAALTAPGSNWGRLFDIRGRSLLTEQSPSSLHAHLSGLLIGMEFEAAATDGYDVQCIHVIGDEALVGIYNEAASVLGADVICHNGGHLIWPALLSLARAVELLETNS